MKKSFFPCIFLLNFFLLPLTIQSYAFGQNGGGFCYDTCQTPPNYEPPPNRDPSAPRPPPPVVPDLGNVRYYNVPAMVFNPGQEGAFVAAAVAAKDVISSTTPEQLVQKASAEIPVLKGRIDSANQEKANALQKVLEQYSATANENLPVLEQEAKASFSAPENLTGNRAPRALQWGMPATSKGGLFSLTKTKQGSSRQELMQNMQRLAQEFPRQATEALVDGAVRLPVNLVGNFVAGIAGQIECLNNGIGYQDCSAAKFGKQDVWAKLVYNSEQEYSAESFAIDMLGFMPLPLAGPATELVNTAAKTGEKLASSLRNGAVRMAEKAAELRFSTESIALLQATGEASVARAEGLTMGVAKMTGTAHRMGFHTVEDITQALPIIERWSPNFKALRLEDAATVNVGYGEPPYLVGTKVVEFETTAPETFFRVHGPDNAARPWVLRERDLTGYSAQEIARNFNIPEIPTRYSRVDIPAGVRVRTGFVGPNAFGKSQGAVQFEIQMQQVPPEWFTLIKDF